MVRYIDLPGIFVDSKPIKQNFLLCILLYFFNLSSDYYFLKSKFWVDYSIQQIKKLKYDKNLSFDDKIDIILKLEKNILQLFETYDKKNYNIFWRETFKTYYNKRTGTITPRITVLLIDSFIDDKYWEVTLGAKGSSKQLGTHVFPPGLVSLRRKLLSGFNPS